jgi:hypothetical protein
LGPPGSLDAGSTVASERSDLFETDPVVGAE